MVSYIWHILIMVGIYNILTLSLNLVVGYTGLLSVGHVAFYGIGAYVSALLTLNLNVPFWVGIAGGACSAGLLGVVIGLPALRLRSDYLALATFGSGVIVYNLLNNLTPVTRGPMGLPGIPRPELLSFRFSSPSSFLVLVCVFVSITIVIMRGIVYSPYGRILKAIREDEIAAVALAKDVVKHKLTVFAIGGFFAGIAGSLYAHYTTFVDPSSFTPMESILILCMVIFGGLGSLKGSMVGATVLIVFPELLRFAGIPSSAAAPIRQMIYGVLLVLLMLRRSKGLLGEYKVA